MNKFERRTDGAISLIFILGIGLTVQSQHIKFATREACERARTELAAGAKALKLGIQVDCFPTGAEASTETYSSA
jgi:hypothetical protein